MRHGAEHPPPLAHLHGEKPPAPDWFVQALAAQPERRTIDVQGAAIDTLVWGPRGAPGLLLMHGNGAHAEWFSFIAPLLADRYRVAALSFSGMGHSGRRESYGVAQWADEALAAAEACGLFESARPPLYVGHSFGGFPVMNAAARHGHRLAGAVIVDTPLRPPAGQVEREKRRAEQGFRPARVYPTIAAALARFRFLPPQDCEHVYIVDHIARSSLQPATDEHGHAGFTWRTDPLLFKHFSFGKPHRDLGEARCPVTLVRGGRSRLITPELLAHALTLAPAGTRTMELPDADHHVMADQPLGFAAMLAGLMEGDTEGARRAPPG
ncbi:alpha/beta fold hydrolase [Ideonella sp. A 288]|uniref:alpha/beta fold hydrolase n=1 Tax=Ideonella sp. A 288 TaxID=1962181 RepID=UPI000B4B32AF|nr:alpha/beta hydrolase [Ideonella sp. A 288]